MVIEVAQFDVPAGREAEFEAAYGRCLELLRAFPGCEGAEIRRSVERPNIYRCFARWTTLEDHTVRFRGSAPWTELRALIAPFSDRSSPVEHFADVGL